MYAPFSERKSKRGSVADLQVSYGSFYYPFTISLWRRCIHRNVRDTIIVIFFVTPSCLKQNISWNMRVCCKKSLAKRKKTINFEKIEKEKGRLFNTERKGEPWSSVKWTVLHSCVSPATIAVFILMSANTTLDSLCHDLSVRADPTQSQTSFIGQAYSHPFLL